MKRKLLILACALSCALGAFAQSASSGSSTESGSSSDFPGQVCAITSASLPPATLNNAYSTAIGTAFCVPALVFSFTGSLPNGLGLDQATGIISGTPTAAGTFSFTVSVTDSTSHSAIFQTALSITSTVVSGAPLPPDSALTSFDTSTAGTPNSGITDCVGTPINPALLPGGSCASSFPGTTAGLQAALNAVSCGHVINVANAVGIGGINLPNNKKCPNSAWIWLTGDLSDPAFPSEGTRPDPSFVGIPQWAMRYMPYPLANGSPNTAARHMPQLITPATTNNPPIRMSVPSSGANTPSIGHWRIQRLECARDQSSDALTIGCIDLNYQPAASGQDCALSGSGVTALPVNPAQCAADQPDHIVITQMVSLGDPQRQTVRAISVGGGTFIVIKDSWIQDIQVSFAGGQGDAQSFAGGLGHGYTAVGNWLFQNNTSSSSTEGTLFCGGFVEATSPVTNADGIPTSVIWNLSHFYKPILWDTQRGQSQNETLVNAGTTYPPVGDQEIVFNPTDFQVQQGLAMSLYNTWLNDSAGGWNRWNDNNATGTVTVDGVDYKTVNSANGIVQKANITVGSNPWQELNIVAWTYTACSAAGNPIAACTGATTPGTHTIVFNKTVVDGRATVGGSQVLGNDRHLINTLTATVTAGAPVNQIFVTPSAPDLQIQPSYSDSFGNIRNFAYVFQAVTNFSSVSMTWKVDGITGGNTTVGRICSVTAVPCVGPASNDTRIVYVAGTGVGPHTITVTSAAGTTTSQVITVSTTSPIWGSDLKGMTVKNTWEAKCLNRGVLKNSILENTFATQGNGGGQNDILINQPINQTNPPQSTDGSGAFVGYGPENISDLLVDHVHVMHVGGGIHLAALNAAKGIHRLSFSNILVEDLNGIRYGHGFLHPLFDVFAQVSGTTCQTLPCTVLGWTSLATPLANDLNFSHITSVGGTATVFGINSWLSIANNNAQFQLGPFSVKDSIFESPGVRPFANNNGDPNDCNPNTTGNSEALAFQGAKYNPPSPCFSTYSLARNLLLDSTAAASLFSTPTIWNNVASTDPTVFRNYNVDGNAGDYRLAAGSQYAAGGARDASDGKDLGAPIDEILANDQAVRWGNSSPMLISTGDTLTATSGVAFTKTLAVSGGTGPYTWSLPTGIHSPGAEDFLDYAAMPQPDRNAFHLSGTIVKYFKLDAGLLWWIKGATGNPWDGELLGSDYVKQSFTENTFTNSSSYKMYVNPVSLWKRYHAPGDDDVVFTPGPNKYSTTDNCGADNQPLIDNLGVRGELTGPFTDVTWQTTFGGDIPDNTPYLLAQKWIKCTANDITKCTNEEDYWLVKGYGQVQWCPKTWNGTTFVTGTCTRETTKTAGGAPTPKFTCGVPKPPISDGMPAGVLRSSAPPMTLVDSTGVMNGTPNAPGVYQFTVQVKDSLGRTATKLFTLTVQ